MCAPEQVNLLVGAAVDALPVNQKEVTMAEVAKHASVESCWTVVDGKVGWNA